MDARQWLELAIEVANFTLERIPEEGSDRPKQAPPIRTSESTEFTDAPPPEETPVPEAPPVLTVVPPAPPTEPLDKDGLPWDARINSGARSFLKNGTWKLLRGVDAVVVAQVKSELAGMARPEPGPSVVPPAAPPVAEGKIMTWAQLMLKISNAALEPAIILAACKTHNVANIGILQDFPAIVPLVAKDLGVE